MPRYYVFWVNETLPNLDAHLIQTANCANAAANLGYPTVLMFPQDAPRSRNPWRWVQPWHPHRPDPDFAQQYNFQDQLQIAGLPMPWPIGHYDSKWTDVSTVACKYYLPVHLRSKTALVHTRVWNLAKAAIQNGLPVVYEQHHLVPDREFPPEIVQHPLFQVAITVADTVLAEMRAKGIPPEKSIKLHNGFNRIFFERRPQSAQAWRDRLLTGSCRHLVAYAGALERFKGIDLLIEIATQMPEVCVALAGGPTKQIEHYQRIVRDRGLANVALVGRLGQQDLADLLQAADVLAYPHLSGKAATFTSPLKLFDYLAAGAPIVSTEIVSLQEVKDWHLIEQWCPPDDPQAFAEGIRRAIRDRPRPPAGHCRPYETIEHLSWESRAAQILELVKPEYRPQRVR